MVRVLKSGGRLILGELGRWNLWAAQRRVKGWLGSKLWSVAHFRSRGDLIDLSTEAGLKGTTVTGADLYRPFGWAARAMLPIDPWFGRWTTPGAAFLILTASRPLDSIAATEQP